LPITAFLKLKDIGQNILPAYTEEIINVPMTQKQGQIYKEMSENLSSKMRECLAKGDNFLTINPNCTVTTNPLFSTITALQHRHVDELNNSKLIGIAYACPY
jgi:hypothetical protein